MPTEHEPSQHATLSPSASDRWIACPASIRMERSLDLPPSAGSIYAQEGTAAHALSELQARFLILKSLTRKAFSAALGDWREKYQKVIQDEDEMLLHSLAYVDLLKEALAEHPNSQLLLEQRVPTGVPSCWGTSDAVIVSPVHVRIVDLKYGQGYRVEVEKNSQLRLYGVGALEAFGDLLGEAETVTMTVFQPRLSHTVSEVLPAAELRAWRDSIIPIAELALGHDAPFGPSDEVCRWCPASGQCKAQLAYATALDFGITPDTLDEFELADALDRIPAIEAWCAAVRDFALDYVYSKRKKIPGYKVAMSGGRRSIKDEEGAIEALTLVGWSLDEVSKRKLNGIGELEKLLKKDFNTVLSPFVSKSEGKPSLVPENDERPSITPNDGAIKDFGEET